MVTQAARFDFGAPHHARRDDVPQAAEVETAGLLVEYLQQRFAEGVADDRHDVVRHAHACAGDGGCAPQ